MNSVIRWIAQLVSLILIRWIAIYPMDSAIHRINHYPADKYCSHVTVKALGLYYFIRVLGGLINGGGGVWGGGGLETGAALTRDCMLSRKLIAK